MSYQLFNSYNVNKIPPPITCAAVNIVYEEKEVNNVFNPAVWGESLWFLFHIGSLVANKEITEQETIKYWNFIEGIPLMLPCKMCAGHAQLFIDSRRTSWKKICETRETLIEFFVDFHNYVNARQNKPLITKEDVKRLSQERARVTTIKYY